MSTNIEKILYLGLAVMMLAMAFSMFFSYYRDYEEYIHQGKEQIKSDNMVNHGQGEIYNGIHGDEVLHQILETKKKQKYSKLNSTYNGAQFVEQEPEIYVNGVEAENIDVLGIEITHSYSVSYETDFSGKVVAVYYISN